MSLLLRHLRTSADFVPPKGSILPIVLTASFVLQAILVWIACIASLPSDKAMEAQFCHADQNIPFHAAEAGLVLIALPIAASWFGYLPRWRRLLAYGIHILWATWIFTIVLAVLAGTGALGDPPCLAVQSPV